MGNPTGDTKKLRAKRRKKLEKRITIKTTATPAPAPAK